MGTKESNKGGAHLPGDSMVWPRAHPHLMVAWWPWPAPALPLHLYIPFYPKKIGDGEIFHETDTEVSSPQKSNLGLLEPCSGTLPLHRHDCLRTDA